MATGLSFINNPCTRSEDSLPILMENTKNHQITLPKERFGLFSLDVVDRDEPKYQIRSPCELANATISTVERYIECFLLHSTVPAQSSDGFLQIIYGTVLEHIYSPRLTEKLIISFSTFLSSRLKSLLLNLRNLCSRSQQGNGIIEIKALETRSVD